MEAQEEYVKGFAEKLPEWLEKFMNNYDTGDAAGNIFDGFPRTTAQAEAFDAILGEDGMEVSVMIYMDVPEEELVKRILLRGKDSGRADDASEDVIRNRIEVYRAQTEIVASHYAKQDKYVAVDGVGSLEEVFERICAAIDAAK